MKYLPQIRNSKQRRGFTLIETVIAMGIITIMITAFLAAFGPAVQGIRKAISAKEANRLASSLEYELSVIRPDEHKDNGGDFSTAFAKAFKWIEESGSSGQDSAILIYQYRGDPASARDDGTLEPQTDRAKQVPGEDYVLQSVVRRLADDKVEEELQPGVVEGRVLYVRMNQLVFSGGELVLTDEANFGKIIDPTEDSGGSRDSVTGEEDYPEAVIAFQAEFYVLKSSIYGYVKNTFSLTDSNGDGHPDAAGRPVFTRNMAIRR